LFFAKKKSTSVHNDCAKEKLTIGSMYRLFSLPIGLITDIIFLSSSESVRFKYHGETISGKITAILNNGDLYTIESVQITDNEDNKAS
jgi:hypothetical protein